MNKTLIRTISIKLDVGEHEAVLQETQRRFNTAASWIARICWDEHISNTNTAHHRVYGETRSRFGLGAQLAVCARAKAVEAVKAARTQEKNRDPEDSPVTCPEWGSRGAVRYDIRTFRLLALDRVSLNTIAGRVICRLLPGKRQHDMLVDPTWEMGSADLVWRRGVYYLNVTQHKDAPEEIATDKTLGVDLGIVNLATDSDGQSFTGAQVHTVRMRYHQRRRELQRVGTRSAKRRLKQLSGAEHRFQKDTNHRIAKTLVQKAMRTRKALALEDLTGIRARMKTVRRVDRYERQSWAFYQLRGFITYKAAWAGVPVHFVDPAYTSQTCSACGHCEKANRQSQASFLCRQCGISLHADVNAAINISRAAVKQPLATSVRG
jgi:putative transposase